MNNCVREYIAELNQNYNDLGEDLLMLEAVVLASEGDTGFSEEYITSGMARLEDYIDQHVSELKKLTEYLICPPHQAAPRYRSYQKHIRRREHA